MMKIFSQVGSGVISARVGQELVLLDSRRGQYYGLNPVAARVWELLSAEISVEQLCDHIASDFDRDLSEVKPDIESYLADLVRLDLVAGR